MSCFVTEANRVDPTIGKKNVINYTLFQNIQFFSNILAYDRTQSFWKSDLY